MDIYQGSTNGWTNVQVEKETEAVEQVVQETNVEQMFEKKKTEINYRMKDFSKIKCQDLNGTRTS